MTIESQPSNIVQGLIIGDEETYIYLFREHYVSLCSYSRKYVGRKDIAEEIVSDTFMKIWESRDKIKIKSSVKAYLFQAVFNNSIYYLRKLKNENKLITFFKDPTFDNIGFAEMADEIDESSIMMENITLKLEEIINQLPTQQQKAFRLKRFEGKKIKEIAEVMGLSVKTVEMHLSKASINLKEKLKDYIPSFLLFLLLR
jgi:RNA polymerase sigma-70 factor, ECF subfamily